MHARLRRDLEEIFGSADAAPSELRGLLDAVNTSYEQAEAEQARLGQALAVASQQLAEKETALNLARALADRPAAKRAPCSTTRKSWCARTAVLETLNDTARALSATLSEQSLFEMIADQARRVYIG